VTFPKIGYFMRPLSTSSTIKNTVELEDAGNLFPGFSASGQDVWLPYFDYDGPAIVLSAVGARCGKTFLADGKWAAIANTTAFAVNTRMASPKFLYYMTNQETFWEKGGAAQPYVKVSETLRKRFFISDLATQKRIAAFLDHETARIDALIEKKEQLVALLEEREGALRDQLLQISDNEITEDLKRPWLSGYCGEWKTQRLSYYLRSSPCYGVLKPDHYEGADAVPIIRIKDIIDGELRMQDIVTISPLQSQEYSRTILRAGDVVLSVVGTIGKILKVDESAAGMNLTRALARVQLSERLSADFLTLAVGSRWFTEYVTVTTQGSAQKVLNMDDLRAWRFPIPPKAEQNRICKIYREQTASLVATRHKTNTSIDRLREYRAALITAAVTGQIDVDDYARRGGTDRRLDEIEAEIS